MRRTEVERILGEHGTHCVEGATCEQYRLAQALLHAMDPDGCSPTVGHARKCPLRDWSDRGDAAGEGGSRSGA